MPTHPRAKPNFRNLIIKPFWMSLKTALRTVPWFGKFFTNDYHAKPASMLDKNSISRAKGNKYHDVNEHIYTADRQTSEVVKSIHRPVTIMYPYERLEDNEPWLFVPGEYNGRIGVIWETCTACKECVRICPNDCLHMTTELRVDVLDNAEGEWEGYGSELEVGGWAAVPIESAIENNKERNPVLSHDAPQEDYRYGEVIDISGDTARVRWNDTGAETEALTSGLLVADQEIVSGRIDMGRCMFCGLCMESCNFTSFFMTNEYDGMSGFTRQDLWFDAARTRVLPGEHQEAVDRELAKRAKRERDKREKKAAKKVEA